jgi:uncharacterized membrane protein YkvA (DUF1232 family)
MGRPWQIVRYLRLAERIIRDRRVEGLGQDASAKMAGAGAALRGVREDVNTLIELVRAWARGEYRDVPLKSVVTIVAGMLYFVVPLDFIPDFIFGLGLLDDITVLTWVVSVVRDEIDRFRRRPIEGEVIRRSGEADAVPAPTGKSP